MPVVVYSLLRAALFLAVTGVLWWAGMRSWLAPVLAAVIAFALSYAVLPRQRDAAARYLAERADRRRTAGGPGAWSHADADAEDHEVEQSAVHRRDDRGVPPAV